MACGCRNKGKQLSVSHENQVTASIVVDHPVVLMSNVENMPMRIKPGVTTVYQRDLADWVRNKNIGSFSFASSKEEEEFLGNFKDIHRDNYR